MVTKHVSPGKKATRRPATAVPELTDSDAMVVLESELGPCWAVRPSTPKNMATRTLLAFMPKL